VEPGYGRACDVDDPDAIENEIRWYVEHPGERSQMGRNGQEKIQMSWNYDTMIAGTLAQIENS
jgi:hypothetical protein